MKIEFSETDIKRATQRIGDREEAIRILTEYNFVPGGLHDVDDIIDRWESDPGY